MDDFRAIPQMAEALQDMIANGQARLATVTAVYLNEVDASLSDGSVARFATTHNGLNAGQRGVIIAAQGGSKIFTPLGIDVKPRSLEAFVTVDTTIGTAGIPSYSGAQVTFTGLQPNTPYKVEGHVFTRWNGSGTVQFNHLLYTGGGTLLATGLSHFSIPGAYTLTHDLLLVQAVNANASGELALKPGVEWGGGSSMLQRIRLLATIIKA